MNFHKKVIQLLLFLINLNFVWLQKITNLKLLEHDNSGTMLPGTAVSNICIFFMNYLQNYPEKAMPVCYKYLPTF